MKNAFTNVIYRHPNFIRFSDFYYYRNVQRITDVLKSIFQNVHKYPPIKVLLV